MRRSFNIFLWSLLHAILLIIVTYFIWNIPSDWTDSGKWLQRIHLARALTAESDTLPDDLVLINTCYDHTMVPVYDDLGLECGQLDITDRAKLLRLFRYLAATDDYRYVVCDIEFDSKLKSSVDQHLFNLLIKMPRVVVPRNSENTSFPAILNSKSAVSEYYTNINNNNFLKYQYLSPEGESIALRMAKELDDITIDQYGLLYLVNGKVCINAHILDVMTNVISEYRPNKDKQPTIGQKNILQLGTDILPLIEAEVDGMFADKIVMIGDCFRDDIHTTVAGPTSGLMIIYNAYHSLISQYNVPPLWVWLSLLTVYAFLTMAIIFQLEPHDLLPKRRLSSRVFLCRIVDWIGFHVLFSFVGIMSFLWVKTYIDAWLCATYFTFFEVVYSFLRSKEHFISLQKLLPKSNNS